MDVKKENFSSNFLFFAVREQNGQMEPFESFSIGFDDLFGPFLGLNEETGRAVLVLESFSFSEEGKKGCVFVGNARDDPEGIDESIQPGKAAEIRSGH